jgi:hypothetical protein
MCVCVRAFREQFTVWGSGFGILGLSGLGLSARTFGRRVNPRAAPKQIRTCLSPPPLLFLSVRVPREPGRRVREAGVRKEGMGKHW